MKLSALLIAKNESKHIADCIKSLSFADEIIVIDDHSDDDTPIIAEQLGAKVFTRALNGDFAGQKNFAMARAQGDWLLLIDCDERITPELATEIQAVIEENQAIAYRLRRINYVAGQRVRFGTLRSDSVCRLIPNQGLKFEGLVHEKLIHDLNEKTLKSPMIHYTYDSWTQYYAKFEQYTRLSAQSYQRRGRKAHFLRDIMGRPLWAFIKVYLFYGGFLDGKIGWILAVNHFHYTMTKYTRLYSLQKNGEDTL